MNVHEITKIINELRKELDWEGRPQLHSVDLVEYAVTMDPASKMVALQLIDYTSYIISILNTQLIATNEKEAVKLLEALKMLEKFTKELKSTMEDLREKNTQAISLLDQETKTRKRLQKSIGQALKVWTSTDESFTNEIATKMANILES